MKQNLSFITVFFIGLFISLTGFWEFAFSSWKSGELPNDFQLSSDVVIRKSAPGRWVGSFSPNQANLTYELVSDGGINDIDNDKFRIEKINLIGYTLILNENIENIQKNTLKINIKVTDDLANSKGKAFLLYISDGEMPATVVLSDTSILEFTPQGSFLGTFSTKDIDKDSAVSYSLITGNGINDKDNSKFTITSDTLKAAFNFNSSLAGSYNIFIEARENDDILQDSVFENADDYKMVLLNLYRYLALNSEQDSKRLTDIFNTSTVDLSFSNYLRLYWDMQEIPTDEAACAWSDPWIQEIEMHTWQNDNAYAMTFYNTAYYYISYCTEFAKRCSDPVVSGFSDTDKTLVNNYKSEARFLRALAYWHLLDMYGQAPYISPADSTGDPYNEFSTKQALYDYIESELKEIIPDLVDPSANEYGRVDKAAAWMLLSKLYLNAEVYISVPKYTECLNYINSIITAGSYALNTNYRYNFMADNNTSSEIIFPIVYDGKKTAGYQGMTYIIYSSVGNEMPLYGVGSGWAGNRAFMELPDLFGVTESNFSLAFPELNASDKRALFYFLPNGMWQWSNASLSTFRNGIGVLKFKNIKSDGSPAENVDPEFVDVDFPMFRLADVYLMYAEAVLRGGTGGDLTNALSYVNALRERAFGNSTGNIISGQLTLDFILDERARELYWEAHRRTDLIRFGKFSGDQYLWSWKGGVQNGTSTANSFDLYPRKSDFDHGNTCQKAFSLSYILSSIEDKEKSELFIYPNPVKNVLNIENVPMKSELSVYSMEGKQIKQFILKEKSIDLNSLPPNEYLLKINNGSSVKTMIIIKE